MADVLCTGDSSLQTSVYNPVLVKLSG